MVAAYQDDLTVWSYAILFAAGEAALRRYQAGAATENGPAFELLRRAVVAREDDAWDALQQLFGSCVRGWCRQAGARDEDVDERVQTAWIRFWLAYSPDKLAAAETLGQVLRYLKLCARSAVLDAARRQQESVALEGAAMVAAPLTPDAGPALDAIERAAFRRLLERHLRDERERVLLRLTYGVGLRPAEIQACRPDLFPTVREVYRVTRNVLDRLRRSAALREWWANGERCA
jgi:DNA-directed RNA polymerase specialized sigma24 family protein